MVNEKTVLQEGLWTDDPDEVSGLVERVKTFNLNNLLTPVKLDVIPFEEGDQFVQKPHFKMRLLFPSREVFSYFWLNTRPTGLIGI